MSNYVRFSFWKFMLDSYLNLSFIVYMVKSFGFSFIQMKARKTEEKKNATPVKSYWLSCPLSYFWYFVSTSSCFYMKLSLLEQSMPLLITEGEFLGWVGFLRVPTEQNEPYLASGIILPTSPTTSWMLTLALPQLSSSRTFLLFFLTGR